METALIDYLFKVAVFLGTAYFFYHTLLRNDVSFLANRLFLLAMLPLSFLLPLAPLRSPFRSLAVSPAALDLAAAMPATQSPAPWSPAAIAVALYWAVAALLILRILFHLFHLYRLQRLHPRERLRNVTLVRVAQPIPPFSFFNRIFLHAEKDCNAREMEQIISHESVHIRQLHSLDILVMELAVALQWFNPVVWLYRKALKETHEYLADREVIAQGFNADGYRLLLFEQHFGAKLFEFASHLKQSQIKRRMSMMKRMKNTGKVPYKIVLALPLVALLALALAQPRLVLAKGAVADEQQTVQKEEKKALSEQEQKELQLKLTEKEKALKEKLSAATDPEEKQRLMAELESVLKKREVLLSESELALKEQEKAEKAMEKEKLKELMTKLKAKEEALKKTYADAGTAEAREKAKQDLDSFYKKRQAIFDEYGIVKVKKPTREQLEKKLASVKEMRLKLKQLIAEEKDEEKLKEHKLKFKELGQFEEELKLKLKEKSQE